MERVKYICCYLVLAIIVNLVAIGLDSSFLGIFLQQNLISILINLLAINIATCTILITKVKDLKDLHGADFSESFKELRVSVIEQIALIGSAFLVLIIGGSAKLNYSFCGYSLVIDILLTTIFVYAIAILWDIGKAVFIIIEQ